MGRKRKGTRLYQKRERWYGDFRDLGGSKEALIPEGERWATKDEDVAAKLLADRVKALEEERQADTREAKDRALGIRRQKTAPLGPFSAEHLRKKARNGEGVPAWLGQVQRHLEEAVRFFGSDIDLGSIGPDDVDRYVEHLRALDNGRGGTLSDTSVRKYLNSLSNVYRRAISERKVDRNPVADMYQKPTEVRTEAEYLEPEEAAILLEAARTYQPATGKARQAHGGAISAKPTEHLFPILATFLLTGGRKSEVLGLEVDDVSFRLGKIYFRSNDWRRLKTRGSKRSVPLWPQLRGILEDYMLDREQEGGLGRLLFPSARGDEEGMIRDLRKPLDRIAERAGLPKGHVRLHMLRHTYTAARIQTLDRGAPVALYTVARELGHRSTTMIEDRYGHLHDRATLGGKEEVAFRVEDHREALGARLAGLSEVPN